MEQYYLVSFNKLALPGALLQILGRFQGLKHDEGLKFMTGSQTNNRNKKDTGMGESKKQVAARFARLKKTFADPLIKA